LNSFEFKILSWSVPCGVE